MAYTIENGMWRSVFAVPNDIVDLHLKLLGKVPLKVLLALLRYDGGLDVSALASVVGETEPVVREAVELLVSEEILKDTSSTEQRPALRYTVEEETPEPRDSVKPKERKVSAISKERRRFERDEINRLAESDETVGWLLQEAQTVLGKTLSASATDSIFALYDYYGMKPDIIMMVLQYCVGIGKSHMGYVEKVAATWIENGIETHEQAEREIQRQTQRHTAENRIKSAFGIYDRSLVTSEKRYIQVWIEDFGFDVPIIALAFERAVEVKGKLSFPYINGILTNWHTKGIKNPAGALRDMKEGREEPAKKTVSAKPSSYDLGELEEMLNQKLEAAN